MKKYIKITDTTTKTQAIKHLESLWGKVFCNLCIKDSTIIKLDNKNDILYTAYNEKYLKKIWYEEIILEDAFKVWEQIACSNKSIGKAIEDLSAEKLKYFYIWWKTSKWLYIVEDEDWYICKWNYIAKIPKLEELTMEQLEKELWRKIKIIN